MPELAAKPIVRDGEGATKFPVTIPVNGGAIVIEAWMWVIAVAHSPLIKTALFASGPQLGPHTPRRWARAGVPDLDVEAIDVYLDTTWLQFTSQWRPLPRNTPGGRARDHGAGRNYIRIDLARAISGNALD